MSRQFVWMRRRPVRVQHGYIRVRYNGLYVSLPADQVPWGRKSCRVEVGFDTGAVAIRRVGGADGLIVGELVDVEEAVRRAGAAG